MDCPLCGTKSPRDFLVEGPRTLFWFCEPCRFVWKDRAHWPPPATEKARYDQHNNGNDGHRAFLAPVVEAIVDGVTPGAAGLDWGSGPVPVLAELLAGRGFGVRTFDPFYGGNFEPGKDPATFDFITLTEVIEHFHDPATQLTALRDRLLGGGLLFVQTQLWESDQATDPAAKFPRWSYRRDPTHVGFFARTTFARFAELFGLGLRKSDGRLAVFEKL